MESHDAIADRQTELTLVKGDHRWFIRYRPGEEHRALGCLARLVSDSSHGLDWSDAAALARQMGYRLSMSPPEERP